MKEVNITYKCDYCGKTIPIEEVKCLMRVSIDATGDWHCVTDDMDSEFHYHDECMWHLLTMKYIELDKKAPITFSDPPKKEKMPSMKHFVPATKKPEKDLPKLKALLDAGWKQKDIAVEFQVSEGTISTWKKELEDEK